MDSFKRNFIEKNIPKLGALTIEDFAAMQFVIYNRKVILMNDVEVASANSVAFKPINYIMVNGSGIPNNAKIKASVQGPLNGVKQQGVFQIGQVQNEYYEHESDQSIIDDGNYYLVGGVDRDEIVKSIEAIQQLIMMGQIDPEEIRSLADGIDYASFVEIGQLIGILKSKKRSQQQSLEDMAHDMLLF